MKVGFSRLLLVVVCLLAPAVLAQNNECDLPGEHPDIIVGDLFDTNRYGTANGITGFSIGTESCNVGSCWANWIGGTPDHPVISQNMFRYKDGRFEHIGQSWLKHGFATLDDPLCSEDCISGGGQHLGVNCSDPYWAGLNGNQSSLGPKFEVDVEAGTHLHPYTDQGETGNAIYKRLQVQNTDLDPALNGGAVYFVEGQYVAADDAAANRNFNNNSYREINVTGGSGIFDISLTGSTRSQQPAIMAWRAEDPSVLIRILGGFVAGLKATDLGGGMWNYEMAVQNMVSTRGAGSLSIPLPHGALVTNVGFHDVDYHSGEPYDGTDWAVTVETGAGPNSITWSTEDHAVNPDANALRWGTLYNFRFDTDAAPVPGIATLGYFDPGSPASLLWSTFLPDRCGDGFCESPESVGSCSADCSAGGPGAGRVPNGDDQPGAQLLINPGVGGDLDLTWGESCVATDSDYEIYEGLIGDFNSHEQRLCSTGGLESESLAPSAGNRYYLVVPTDGTNQGSFGEASGPTPRSVGASPCRPQQVSACP